MKKIICILLLCPLFTAAQTYLPSFENDTLTTTGGYKIYKGQVLQFASGSGSAGYFRFVKFHPSMVKNNTYILQNSTLLVKSLKGYKYAGPENNTIRILGTATYTDGKKEEVDILMNFERAITGADGLAAELTVPETFRTVVVQTAATAAPKPAATVAETKKQASVDDVKRILVADEIKKLFDLYKSGALTKEEYEVQKKKLLDRQ